jgi:hypothetical protein
VELDEGRCKGVLLVVAAKQLQFYEKATCFLAEPAQGSHAEDVLEVFQQYLY